MVGAAASSCYASPLCTFFVAACMSLSHGGGDTRQAFGRSRRRRQQLGKCSGSGSILVSSCLEFKPCSHYNKNNKGNAFPLLGSNSLSLNRKQRKLNRATSSSSGINILLPKSQVLVEPWLLQWVFNDAIEALKISYKKMNPFCVPFATTNMGSAMLAMDLGWMGPNYSISTACATSNFCILNSANHIIRGEADVMLCGGSDAVIIPIGLGGFVACRALSQRNNDPTKASRPWDSNRDGFVMGEGAGVLLLEELEHAKKRGATIYAEFLGGSFTCDAYHMTEPRPDGAGVILCIERALADAGISKEQINYINAHATSTPAGDLKEYQALAHCFGQNPELKVNSTKSMIGHLLGAAGAVEAVATIQAIRTGWVHPNINLENPDNGVDTSLLVGPKKERLSIKAALSNSFGFGGHNSSIIFAPYK
ncbi:hypothetical protein F2Q68_00045528 [Brassica cretica]|uniref:beta-ketoacyl-[acyl-carrier-protein] synthase I n=1 Tax=Brassica cretica TaxID=69181 RepID=A0A8S9LK34_BRACR|nr:hypothetical protein F2Q68_00045528 [Brassica cretica]